MFTHLLKHLKAKHNMSFSFVGSPFNKELKKNYLSVLDFFYQVPTTSSTKPAVPTISKHELSPLPAPSKEISCAHADKPTAFASLQIRPTPANISITWYSGSEGHSVRQLTRKTRFTNSLVWKSREMTPNKHELSPLVGLNFDYVVSFL